MGVVAVFLRHKITVVLYNLYISTFLLNLCLEILSDIRKFGEILRIEKLKIYFSKISLKFYRIQ